MNSQRVRGAMALVAIAALALLVPCAQAHASTSITVSVRTLSGSTIIVNTVDTDLVLDLKGSIEAANGTPVANQRLVFRGRQLEDAQQLIAYGITDGALITLVVRLRDSAGTGSPAAVDGPRPWLQAYARSDQAAACLAGWSPSWAQWPHGSTGGWTCERVVMP